MKSPGFFQFTFWVRDTSTDHVCSLKPTFMPTRWNLSIWDGKTRLCWRWLWWTLCYVSCPCWLWACLSFRCPWGWSSLQSRVPWVRVEVSSSGSDRPGCSSLWVFPNIFSNCVFFITTRPALVWWHVWYLNKVRFTL